MRKSVSFLNMIQKMLTLKVTTQTLSQLGALEQVRSISYNFLVADYGYTTATLSYRSLWHLSEVHYRLVACCTTAHTIPPQHFDGNGASLQHQMTSLNRLCVVFLALLTQLRYRYTTVAWPSSAQQVGCLYLSSHLFYMYSFNYHQLEPICRS